MPETRPAIPAEGCECSLCRDARQRDQAQPADPWAHRSKGMRCSTCMWFVPKDATPQASAIPVKVLGRCRRHAPTLNGYPAVFETDWCGDHKLDETKVAP